MARKRKKRRPQEAACAPTVDKDWQARSDLDTLGRAQDIVKDSERFRKAKAEAKRQREALDRIGRLEGKNI